jgi:hypothetical protein
MLYKDKMAESQSQKNSFYNNSQRKSVSNIRLIKRSSQAMSDPNSANGSPNRKPITPKDGGCAC